MSNFVGLYVRVTTADGLREGLVTKVENGMLSLRTQNGPVNLPGDAIKSLNVIERGQQELQLPDPRQHQAQTQPQIQNRQPQTQPPSRSGSHAQQPRSGSQTRSGPPGQQGGAPGGAPGSSGFSVNSLFDAHRAEMSGFSHNHPHAPKPPKASSGYESSSSLSDQELVSRVKQLNRKKKNNHKHNSNAPHNNSNYNADWETDTSFTGDFDFQANLQKFDKQQVFDEIRECDNVPVEQRLVSHNKNTPHKTHAKKHDFAANAGKVPHNEMVLKPVTAQSRWIEDNQEEDEDDEYDDEDGGDRVTTHFVSLSDSSHIPVASEDQYNDVMRLVTPFMASLIENCGLKLAELVIRLSGGNARFGSSSNFNPLPFCVVLVGDSEAGKKALSAASHLSNHGLKVVALLIKPRESYDPSFELKFNFFELCYGKVVVSVADFTQLARKNKLGAPEVAILSAEIAQAQTQSVFDAKTTLVCVDEDYVSKSKAVLVSTGIPLEDTLQSKHTHYLIDMGLPQKIFEIERFKPLTITWGGEWCVQLEQR
ncbi:hypothetical protein B0I72DRAFT_136167 [Yarrowia lipolytica]|uniref:Enhancer of mRNA-decapping protein 3 n=2 Tax=Yarrowia lipolytica TaxID=4952 RepID=Q6C942_YARLI|nr:YALI0D14410p [Yarrowia lipolytica CLIB122]AOW04055.1 hypothetical protein YALI1_D17564g [Yarrowia lipolytica]KAB8285130.1 hypothetical protein BKA91DRAFT_133867 [Yarrowia lipolytica]KAE8171460.1 hypothetical protein BKA90DRAFT_139031 [Yarrowia lipolytica]KAJ8054394.1 hypothetical protein LXG23DRAFT_36493 [Yarrowia lipolytica]RDW25647.1 hypothetical protein B0I71DRAFT_132194 [Yarrowia lipolytica]|eukprot:XP_502820.1 YALI0D14410p [Yarrowia lipolytica CLIB122]